MSAAWISQVNGLNRFYARRQSGRGLECSSLKKEYFLGIFYQFALKSRAVVAAWQI